MEFRRFAEQTIRRETPAHLGLKICWVSKKELEFFAHNDMRELEELLGASNSKRKIVAVEGIYSMDGDLVSKEVFEICDIPAVSINC